MTSSKRSPETGANRSPFAELDVRHAVEPGVEARERDRARVEVDPDDARRVTRRQQRLHAAAAADVECRAHRATHGQPGEQQRRRVQADHVVAAEAIRARMRHVVSEHEAFGDDETHARQHLARPAARRRRVRRLRRARAGRAPLSPRLRARRCGARTAGSACAAARWGRAVAGAAGGRPAAAPSQGQAEHRGGLGAQEAVGLEGLTKPRERVRRLRIQHPQPPGKVREA